VCPVVVVTDILHCVLLQCLLVYVFEGFNSGNGDQYFNATFQVGVPPSVTGVLTALLLCKF